MVADNTKLLVYIVDDDESVLKSLKMLFVSADIEVIAFGSAQDFLESTIREENTCLISDISMKGISGLELQKRLTEREVKIPVIFLTAFDSTESRKLAKEGGASAFFRKPVDDQALLDSVKWATKSHLS